MSSNPSYVKVNRGAIPTWSDFNALADLVQRQRLRQGVGYIIREGVGGTTLRINGGGGLAVTSYPYEGSDASDATSSKVKVAYGTHNGTSPQIDGVDLLPPIGTPVPALTLSNSAKIVYVEFDFTFNTTQQITSITNKTINSSNSTSPPANTLTFGTDGSGTGSLYQTLFGVTVKVPTLSGSNYSVTIAPSIKSSQIFYICGTSILTQSTT